MMSVQTTSMSVIQQVVVIRYFRSLRVVCVCFVICECEMTCMRIAEGGVSPHSTNKYGEQTRPIHNIIIILIVKVIIFYLPQSLQSKFNFNIICYTYNNVYNIVIRISRYLYSVIFTSKRVEF